MRRLRATTALTAAALGAALVSGPATATATPVVSDPIVSGLAGPLQMDVGRHGILVGQSFAGLLTHVAWNGDTHTLAAAKPAVDGGSAEISGVASRRGWIAYTQTQYGPAASEEGPSPIIGAQLRIRKPNGKTYKLADLLRFERKRNPDAHQRYGFLDLDDECAAEVPAEAGGGEPTAGIVDSHPYAVAAAPHGGWYVADAGGNDILHVSKRGRIHVAYVAKPQKVTITADMVAALKLPECTEGATYAFEAVPTDVEVTRHGKLVVSLLPGGPEDPSFGARGSVVMVDPYRHRGWTLARGLAGATNVAVGRHGKVYVAELFGGRVSVIRHGHVRPVVELPLPAAVEYAHGALYVSINALPAEGEAPDGQIVKVRLR